MKKLLVFTLMLCAHSTFAGHFYHVPGDTLPGSNAVRRLETADDNQKVAEIFEEMVVPTRSINVSKKSDFDLFFREMTTGYLTIREADISLGQRIAGIRAAQRAAKSQIKENYIRDYRELIKSSIPDKDKKIRELRQGLSKSVIGMRTVSNTEYRYAYYEWDIKEIRFFPSRNARIGQLYYGELKDSSFLTFLRSQFLTLNEEFGAMSSELVAGYLGPFRVGLNTAITNARQTEINTADLEGKTDDEIQEVVNNNHNENLSKNTLATVVTGGGLLGLKAQYPLVHVNPIWSEYIKFDNELVGTLSGNFDVAGTETPENEMQLWGSYGLENNLYISLKNFDDEDGQHTPFGFFLQYNIRHVSGSGSFEESIGITEGFWMGEFKVGIYYSGIQITYKYLNFSNRTLDGQFQNTFTIGYGPTGK